MKPSLIILDASVLIYHFFPYPIPNCPSQQYIFFTDMNYQSSSVFTLKIIWILNDMKSGVPHKAGTQQMLEMMVAPGHDDDGGDHNPNHDGGASGDVGSVISRPLPLQSWFSCLFVLFCFPLACKTPQENFRAKVTSFSIMLKSFFL